MKTNDIYDVAVVGAGPAGLSAAYELTRAGLTPLVLERTSAVGDVWRNHYDGLCLNTGRFFSALPGSKFPPSAGGWPSRDAVVSLLETFPARGGFTVQTSIEIEKVSYDRDRDIWLITSSDNQQFESRAVVIAAGANRIKIVGPIQKISGGTVEVLSTVEAGQHSNQATTTLQPDVIVSGTGFRTGFSELVQIPGITDEKDRSRISGDEEFEGAPRLYFIGQINPLSGQLREIRLEAGKIAKKLSRQLKEK